MTVFIVSKVLEQHNEAWKRNRIESLMKWFNPDKICNSSYCQPYNSYSVSSENLVLDQLIIPKLVFVFILVSYLVDILLIL